MQCIKYAPTLNKGKDFKMVDNKGPKDFEDATGPIITRQELSERLQCLRRRGLYKLAMDGPTQETLQELETFFAEEIEAYNMLMVNAGAAKKTGGSQDAEIPEAEEQPYGSFLEHMFSMYDGTHPSTRRRCLHPQKYPFRHRLVGHDNPEARKFVTPLARKDALKEALEEVSKGRIDIGFSPQDIEKKIRDLDPTRKPTRRFPYRTGGDGEEPGGREP